MQGYAPQIAIEFGRKVLLYSTDRPTFPSWRQHVKGDAKIGHGQVSHVGRREETQPIIIKAHQEGRPCGHGGAWKIAYADFVTAMMAFFLLMWLLGSTTEGDKEGHRRLLQLAAEDRAAGRRASSEGCVLVIRGGGRTSAGTGQVKGGDIEAERRTINLAALKAEARKAEMAKLGAQRQGGREDRHQCLAECRASKSVWTHDPMDCASKSWTSRTDPCLIRARRSCRRYMRAPSAASAGAVEVETARSRLATPTQTLQSAVRAWLQQLGACPGSGQCLRAAVDHRRPARGSCGACAGAWGRCSLNPDQPGRTGEPPHQHHRDEPRGHGPGAGAPRPRRWRKAKQRGRAGHPGWTCQPSTVKPSHQAADKVRLKARYLRHTSGQWASIDPSRKNRYERT